MTETVENLILAQLREMRAEMAAMRGEIAGVQREVAAVRGEIAHVDAKIDGVSLLLTMLAGHVPGLEGRFEAIETVRP